MTPWLVPAARMELTQVCGGHPAALPIANPDSSEGRPCSDRATLVIDVSPKVAGQEPFRSGGRRLTERDFPTILETLREQNRVEFGSDADRPA